jgi:hypothetical protein
MKYKNTLGLFVLSAALLSAPFISFADNHRGVNSSVDVGINASLYGDEQEDDRDTQGSKEKEWDDDKGGIRDGDKAGMRDDDSFGIRKGFLDWKVDFSEKKDDFKEARDEWKDARPEARENLKVRFGMALFGRFDVVARGLQNIHDRIENRMNQEKDLSAEAKTKATAELALAQSDINTTEAISVKIKAMFDVNMTVEERKAKQEELKKLITDAKASVKSAHEHLKNAFKAIKLDINAHTQENVQN